MPRGYIRWEVSARPQPQEPSGEGLLAAVEPLSGAEAFMGLTAAPDAGKQPLEDLLAAAGRTLEAAEPLPTADQPLEPRDEAVFMLYTAAEIEHALLVQYLYAAFSLGDRSLRKAEVTAGTLTQDQYDKMFKPGGWQQTVIQIAKEEMGHLLTVQNLLILIGGPITLQREEFPFRSQFYPFPFRLEPLTKDALAKFVAAERPPRPDPTTYPKVAEIDLRALRANQSMPVNQVGALYQKIIELFKRLPVEAFFPETVDTFQAKPADWGKDEPAPQAQPGPRDILAWSFGGTAPEARAKAIRALEQIAQQGEGATGGGGGDSHFARFYKIYEDFAETNPRYGNLGWLPALPVPSQPNTAPYQSADESAEDGRITDGLARAWAHLFNLRYRMLLANLSHYLQLDASKYPKSRAGLHEWTFEQMSWLTRLSGRLTSLPRQSPNLYDRGRPAVAGAPFEMPFTLDLPGQQKARWARHRSLLKESGQLIKKIRSSGGDAGELARSILEDMSKSDTAASAQISQFEAEPTDKPAAPPAPPPVGPAAPPPAAPPPAATAESDMLALVAFLKGPPHNAAGRHGGVDIGGGRTLADLFANPAALLTHLKTQSVIQDDVEAGKKLVVPGKPDDSAFFRIIQRDGHPMKPKFALAVPVVNKTGVDVVRAWISSLA